jgi:4-amino-4-deoxy-L-arabinose transferase-like glycosyltransferase
MTPPRPLVDRIARYVVVAATLWLTFTAVWGLWGIPGDGHIGAGDAGTVMAAEEMIRWKILYPSRAWYTGVRPEGGALMCHHPYGQYYVSAILYWLFGHHDMLIHLPAVLMSAAIPPLLYAITKPRWGAPVAAVAAAAYVVVPIAVGFSNYWNLETLCIFGVLLFFWGHSKHMETSRRRWLAVSLLGLWLVVSGDWIGNILVAPTLGWAFLRAFVLPARMTERFKLGPYATWWAASVVITAFSLAWFVGLFVHADQLQQWLGAGDSRGGGKIGTMFEALQARRAWIDFSFTPLCILIGKIAAPLCLVRFLVTRRDEDLYVLGILFGASVQYVAFKRGADVHIYWPHYFAVYFALALSQLAGTIGLGVAWVLKRLHRPYTHVAATVGIVVGLMPVAAMAHDGVAALWVWRRTGGRYDEHGGITLSQIDMVYVMKEVLLPVTRRGTGIDVHRSVPWYREFQWEWQGIGNKSDTPAVGGDVAGHPFWMARASGMLGDEQRKVASSAHVRVYGDTWIVDQREPAAPLDAYEVEEREPNPFEWLVYGGTEPMRSIGPSPDPWLTWEWRTHLGQPADTPAGEPKTLDETRIAHNVAITAGDEAAAERWREAIDKQLDRTVSARFTSGVRLVGVRLIEGVQPRVQCWFEWSGEPGLGDATFDVRSTVEARGTFSLIPPDPTDREMGMPPRISTKLWKPRFLYSTDIVLNHRIGRERYWGAWKGREGGGGPRRMDGQQQTTLVVLP